MRLVLLLEEPSMKALLDELLPRAFPELAFLCVPHEGKSDLEASIPRKLRAWNEPGAVFLVIRDNDGADCKTMKARLTRLCAQGGKPETMVRIACQELEAWYLGDLAALGAAYDVTLTVSQAQNPYRRPDTVGSPSNLVKTLVPEFRKTDGARRMGAQLSVFGNVSPSFNALLSGIQRITNLAPRGIIHT